VDVSAVNRNLQPPDVAPATPPKPAVASHHLDRQAGQTVIQVVDGATKPAQSEALPEDILELGEVVNQPEGRTIR
jgi:hypothetical protein